MAYVVAGAELLDGIGLLIPRFVRMHATKIPGGLAGGVPAIVLLDVLV